jgi:hypothetical protein
MLRKHFLVLVAWVYPFAMIKSMFRTCYAGIIADFKENSSMKFLTTPLESVEYSNEITMRLGIDWILKILYHELGHV